MNIVFDVPVCSSWYIYICLLVYNIFSLINCLICIVGMTISQLLIYKTMRWIKLIPFLYLRSVYFNVTVTMQNVMCMLSHILFNALQHNSYSFVKFIAYVLLKYIVILFAFPHVKQSFHATRQYVIVWCICSIWCCANSVHWCHYCSIATPQDSLPIVYLDKMFNGCLNFIIL